MAIGAGNAGAWAAVNATTQTVTLPTHAAGDQLILVAACKAATPASIDIQVTTPATGWEKIGQFADGTTGSGTGTGSVTQAVFRRICLSNSETNPVVTWGGSQTSTPGIAVAIGFTKASDEVWVDPALVQAATNNATSISVTMGSNPGIGVGDFGLAIHTTRDDSALTVPTWTATGTTLGTATVFPTTPIASGTSDDMAGTIAYRSVTAGIATAAPVVTATQAAAETGVTAFVRLRLGNITPNRKLLSGTRDSSSGSSTVGTGSVTVTAGNTIFVAAASFVGADFGSESVTDNLGNTYTLVTRLRHAADSERLSLYMAPVTNPGTMTTLTYNHDTASFAGTIAIEYANVGDISGSPYSNSGNAGTTNTWLASTSIPAGGMAVGGAMNAGSTNITAGAASGTPSVTIVEADGWGSSGLATTLLHGLASTAVTGFTGTVTQSASDWVTVGAVYSRLPSITATPTTAALTLSTFAPTVTILAPQLVTPDKASLTITAFAPTVTLSDNQIATPATATLAVTAFAPVLKETTTPTTAALTTATFAPAISVSDNQAVTPSTTALSLATFAPSVSVTAGNDIVVPNAALTLSTFAPTVSLSDHQLVTPTTTALTLATFAPVIKETTTPTTAALITAKFAPTVTATNHQTTTPTTKALTLSTFAPSVVVNETLVPTTRALTLSTFAPTVTATTNTVVELEPATSLVLTTYAPTIDLSAFKLVIPATAALVLTGYPPTAEQHSITPLPRIVSGTVVIARGPGATVTPLPRGSTTVVAIRRPSARVRR